MAEIKPKLKKLLVISCGIITQAFASCWTGYQWFRNCSKHLKTSYNPEGRWYWCVMALLKLLSLLAALWVVLNLRTSLTGYTSRSKFIRAWCTTQKPWPDILICPKPFGNRTYGGIFDEGLVMTLGLSDAEMDLLSEYKMTGNMPDEGRKVALEKKVGKSIDDIWISLIDLKTNFSPALNGPDPDGKKASIYCIGYFPHDIVGSPVCGTDKSYHYMYKHNDFCPLFDWYRNVSTYADDYRSESKDYHKRRIWHTGLKSRCVFMEKKTHKFTHYARFMWRTGRPELIPKYWFWLGDRSITSTDDPKVFDEVDDGFHQQHISIKMYHVMNSPTPQKTVCQTKLSYDGGLKYPCPDKEETPEYWLYEKIGPVYGGGGNPGAHIRLSTIDGLLYKNVPAISEFGSFSLFVGTIDLFVGLSAFYLVSVVLGPMKKSYKLLFLILQMLFATAFFGIGVFFIVREWQSALDAWYSTNLAISEEKELPLPTINLGGSFQNFTKYTELNISFPLLFYLEYSGNFYLEYKHFQLDYKVPTAKMLQGITDECQNASSPECTWDAKERKSANLLFPFVYSPHNESILKMYADGMRFAYGNRYQSITNYDSLVNVLHAEYEKISHDAMGRKPDDVALNHEVGEFLNLDVCQLIVSCHVGREEIPNCCKMFRYAWALEFYNDGQRVPVLKQKRAGREHGLKIRLNASLIIQHSINAYPLWNGGILKGKSNIERRDMTSMYFTATGSPRPARDRDFRIYYPHDKLAEQYTVIDMGFTYDEDTKLDFIENHRCVPFDKNKDDEFCMGDDTFRNFATVELCGCRNCFYMFDVKPFKKWRCCTALETLKCVTRKRSYRMPCFDTDYEPGAPRNEFVDGGSLEGPRYCDSYDEWIARDPDNEIAELFSDRNRSKLNEMMGYEFWLKETDAGQYQVKCKNFQHCGRVNNLLKNQAISTNSDGEKGILEVNYYFVSMTKEHSYEIETFQPWEFGAIVFGAWSIFFNEPLIELSMLFALFLKTIWLVCTGKLSIGDLFASDNAVKPNDEACDETRAKCVDVQQQNAAVKSSGEEIDKDGSLGIAMSGMQPGTSKVTHVLEMKPDSLEHEKRLGAVSSISVQEAADEVEQMSLLKKNIFGFLVVASAGLFVASSYYFGKDHELNPTTTLMNVSKTTGFPIPSLGLCLENNGDIEKVFNSLNLQCKVQNQPMHCKKIFYTFHQNNGLSCLLSGNARGSNALSQPPGQNDWQIINIGPKENLNSSAEPFIVWLGDMDELTGNKSVNFVFQWDLKTSVVASYTPYKWVNAPQYCHDAKAMIKKCGTCEKLSKHFQEPYLCCINEHADVAVQDLNQNRPTQPCNFFTYPTFSAIDFGFKDSTVHGQLSVSRSFDLLTTYVQKNRYDWRGMIIIISPYWGMLLGVSVFEMLVTLTIPLAIAYKICTKKPGR